MTRPMRAPRLLRSDTASTGVDRPATVPPAGRTRPAPGAPTGASPTAAPATPPTGPAHPNVDRPDWAVPSAAVDPAGGRGPARYTGADAAQVAGPPRQRVPGPSGDLRAATPPGPTATPNQRPAPADPPVPGENGPWALVRRAQAGDMTAFSELFDRYYDVVFRYVLFRMNDRTLAEDVTQETFLRALRRISSVTYQGRDIGAWFVTIARNLIFDHVKSSRYRLESTTSDIVELSPSTHGPEQQVLDMATNEELLRCIRKLNADQQECISLRFLQGLSVAETAAIMDRNEGAVKALQHRAVRRLAQLLPEGLR
jgi:RNA polymerase sigma-70 factor (ECF subfamily)